MKNVTMMKKMRQNAGMKSKVQHGYWKLALLMMRLMLNTTRKVDVQATTNGGDGTGGKLCYSCGFMKIWIIFFMLLFQFNLGWGQTIANYNFTSNVTSSLEDLTTGSTSLLTGNNDDAATSVTAIGFDFFYGGVRYTHFSANSNGQMRLHTSSGATAIGASGISTYTASTATLFPMSGDNEVNDGVKYKLIGTAPNRKLVVEWSQFYAYYTNLTNAGNMQAWLDEATGAITYVYGEIYNSSSSASSRGIALSFSNTATTARYVTVAASPTSTPSATLTTNSFAAGSGSSTGSPLIANLGTNNASARRAYVFTPSNATVPSSLTFSSIGLTSMTLNWNDNASDEVGYVIYYSTDAINYTYYASTAANAVSQNVTGLLGGTTYYWKVYALRETIGTALTGTQATSACGTYSGTMSVGPTGTFNNLTTAITNLTACGYTGNIILELQSSYVSTGETFPLTFNAALGSSATKTITIRPATGATGLAITSANTTGTIKLDGGSYIIFDGRPGGSGSRDLVIANTNAGSSYAVQFINDANNNAFNYCKINSCNNSTSSGTIVFSTTTGSNGNDNNTIDNCEIYDGASTPYNAIYASGTASPKDNSNNTISNCNIYNYFSAGSATNGMLISTGNTGWTISNNKLYQTATRVYTTGNTHYGINIGAGDGYIISGNTIGYANSTGTGTTNLVGNSVALTGTFPSSYTTTGIANQTKFVAISGAYTAAGAVSNIQGNNISGIALYTSSSANTANGVLCGIQVTSGNANIGTTTANIIGSSSGTSSLYAASTASGAAISGIYCTSANTISIQNNIIGGIDVSGTTASCAAGFKGIDVAGTAVYTVSGNTIGNSVANNIRTGYLLTGTNLSNTATTPTSATGTSSVTGILCSSTGSTASISNNTIQGVQISGSATTFNGISNTGAQTSSLAITNNILGTSGTGLVTYVVANSGAFAGISATGSGTTTSHQINSNDFRGITHSAAGTNTVTLINLAGATAANNISTINNNTFTNLTVNTTGAVTFINHSYAISGTGQLTLDNNSVVGGFVNSSASATIASTSTGTTGASGAVFNFANNNFSGFTLTGASAFTGLNFTESSSACTKTITGNTFANLNTGAATINLFNVTAWKGSSSLSSNTISNINGQGAISGITIGNSVNTATTIAVESNNISGLKSTGAGGNVTGIASSNTSTTINIGGNTIDTITSTGASSSVIGVSNTGACPNLNIYQNTIKTLSGSGATSPVCQGIATSAGTNVAIYKNKIYDLLESGAISTTSPSITGVLISGGTTVTTYNNLIGDLRAPSASLTDAIRGMAVTSTTSSATYKVYYNTMYLSGSGGANFGTSGIYHTTSSTSTTASLDLRNNIIVNTSTPSGSGKTVAYRRSSTTLTNYAATSNNNIFYAGTPGTNNLIMYDGTNSYQTLATFKSAVSTRDANSFTENPTWLGTNGSDANFLHLNTSVATQAESGAVNIPTFTDDFDGVIRQGNAGYAGTGTAPDIGADEGEFNNLDATAPIISYTALGNSSSISGQSLSVTITDPAPGSGVNTTSGTKPRIYFKRLTDANTYVDNTNATNGWKYVETSSGSSPFEFAIDFSLIYNSLSDAVSAGDIIQYFVVAQDLAATPNVGINNGVFAVNPSSVALTSTAFPITGTINQYEVLPSGGSYTVGAGGQPTYNYASLTCANGFFAAMNQANTRVSSNMTVSVSTDLTEDGTNALNQWTETGAGNYTLAIQPSGARTVSGNVATPLISLNGADRVTIDGLNTGGNSMTISNLSTSASSGTSTIKFINDATNNTVTNCTVLGSATVSLATDGGTIWFSTGATTGNDNNAISNCKIGPAGANLPSKGIYAYGSTGSSAICNSNVSINNCEIYDFFLANGCAGIYVYPGGSNLGGCTDWSITNNKFYESASRAITGTMYGIYFANSSFGNNIQITGNTIGYSSNSGTGTLTLTGTGNFRGIDFAGMSTASLACSLNSNIISDISFTSSTGTFHGIYNSSSASSNTININSNQIKNIATLSTSGTVIGIYAGSATTLNCNSNTIDNISRSGAGVFYGIQYTNPTTITLNGNTIRNLSSTSNSSTLAFNGIYSGSTASTENITGNNIYNLTTSSTGAQTLIGIVNSAGSGTKNIQNNNVYSLTAAAGSAIITGIKLAAGTACEVSGNKVYTLSGGITLYGIQIAAGTTVNTFKNKIYDITSVNASPTVYGLYLSGGTTNNVYNNIIGDLKTTAANSAIPLAGIYINTSTANIYYNTVYLNATSSGALFGSTAIYANTAATVNFRNNIFVNNSTPKGAGIASAYRRSSTTLTSYAVTSNNNLFYAGTPGTYNLIFYDGTNSDQTLAAFKTRMSTRDQASISENPTWASTTGSDATYLHIDINSTTAISNGGANIATYTDDYDGAARQGNPGYVGNGTAPDIGADEFNPPYCIEVSGVNTTGITANSAVMSWTENGTATNWDIELGATGFTPVGTPTAAVSENPYTYSGLTPNTSYSYYVRANCGGTNSIWVGPFTFSTLPTCVTPTGLTSSAVAGTTATISWTAASPVPSNGYQYEVRTSGAAGSGSTGLAVSGTTAGVSANITGLLGETTYYVYVRSDCGAADYSEWTNSHSFTTTISCFTPTSLASSAITHESATLTWVAPTPTPSSGYDIYYGTSSTAPTDVTTPTATVGVGVLTYNMTGLNENTTYYAWVRSHCIGTDVSDWTASINFTTPLPPRIFINATSSTAYGEYATVKSAFDAINAGTHQGVISITLGEADNAVITETAQAVLNKSGVGAANYSSVTISPAYSNITVTGNLASATIQLNLAQNVTIDGRIGSSGTTKNLTIENPNTSSSSKGAIEFYGASNDTIRYCTLKSSTTSKSGGSGTVSFNYNTNAGCSNNLIEYCDITKSGANWPCVAIASSNTSSVYPSQNNTVRYCTIYDFKIAGIWLGCNAITYNNLWTISNNTIYESSSFAYYYDSGSGCYYPNHGVYIGYHDCNATASSYTDRGTHTISNNTIGGNGSTGNWTVTGSSSSDNFAAPIYVAASNTSYGIDVNKYTYVFGNIIKDFDVQASYFGGIWSDRSRIKIGDTISGYSNYVYNIILRHVSTTDGGTYTGISASSSANISANIVSNNFVHDITAEECAASYFSDFFGINTYNGSSTSIGWNNRNKVYNISTAKAINTYGMRADGNCELNHVSKIKINYSTGLLFGLYWVGCTDETKYRVENNEVVLGLDKDGNATASAAGNDIIGLYLASQEVMAFYNSILIQGGSSSNRSACLRLNFSGPGATIKNNLLYNVRSGGAKAANSHLCISSAVSNAADLVSSNNAYIKGTTAQNYVGDWATATGVALGYTGGTLKSTLADWVAVATSENGNSIGALSTDANRDVATMFPSANATTTSTSYNLKPVLDLWLCAGVDVAPKNDFVSPLGVVRPTANSTIGAYEINETLPVELLNITARKSGSGNVVEWQTASETNNDYFEVQKSTDATDWVKIGIVKGAGNSNSVISYSFIDDSPTEGKTVYYRLKQVDYDGRYSHSPIVSVDNSGGNISIVQLYPVPANDIVYMAYHSTKNNQFPISFKLYNCFGAVVKQDLLADGMDGGHIQIKVDDLAPGTYCLSLDFGGETKTLKLVVMR